MLGIKKTSNKSFFIRILICIIYFSVFFIVIGFFVNSKYKLNVEINQKTYQDNQFNIYYDTGKGFIEKEKVSLDIKSNNFEKIRFVINGDHNVKNLRFNPALNDTKFYLKDIELSYRIFNINVFSKRFSGKEIGELISNSNFISDKSVDNEVLSLKCIGSESYFLVNIMYKKYQGYMLMFLVLLCFFISLILTLLFLMINYNNSFKKHFYDFYWNYFNKIWIYILIFLLVIVNIFYATFFIMDEVSSHNMIANLLMAAAPILNLGVPYKDYWDIYSPGIYIFLTPFELFFHGETFVFKIFHILFATIIGLIVLKFLLEIFKKFVYKIFPVVLFFLLYLLLSNYYFCILFHNAFLGLFFTMAGLYLLAFSKNNWIKYFLSTLLIAFAGSIKESFLFIIFLPYIYVIARYLLRDYKNFQNLFIKMLQITSGIISVISINFLYLVLMGNLKYYQEITAFKSTRFNLNSFSIIYENLNPFYNLSNFNQSFEMLINSLFINKFGFLYSMFLFILIIVFVSFKIKKINNKKLEVSLGKWNRCQAIGLIITGFLIFNFEGFKLLNSTQANYSLQMIPAIILSLAFLYKILYETIKYGVKNELFQFIKKYLLIALTVSFILCCYPQWNQYKFFKIITIQNYFKGLFTKKPVIQLPDRVKQFMGEDKRIFNIYGWGTPNFYYFSHTQPFSRFFIIHPNIMGSNQYKDLVNQFKKELPKVIIYSEISSDIDISSFEKDTIHIKLLIDKCYEFYAGYYLLKDEKYFKEHKDEFISKTYL